MSPDQKCFECHSGSQKTEKNKDVSSDFRASKSEILSDSQSSNKKLLEELKNSAKNLQTKVETT
jgi:peptide subunit release factor 1 (eRF1)